MNDAIWTVKGGRVLGPAPFFIAGVVNATPDSFYDGGRHDDAASAVRHGLELARQGAHILDVGGESTRPYADPVSAEEERRRVAPVIEGLCARLAEQSKEAPVVSVDTTKAIVAEAALDAGADILNDVSAFAFDPRLLDVVADRKPGYVLMHSLGRPETMQDAPRYDDAVDDILAFFEDKLAVLANAGLPEDRIVLDPGIGFGKLLGHNLQILRGIERFKTFGLPLYIGLSNKSLWQGLLGLAVDQRHNATQAATAIMAAKGCAVHRVHEVELTRQTLTIVQEIA